MMNLEPVPPVDPGVMAVFDSYPTLARERVMRLRELIFEVTADVEAIGEIEETLKWGEPAYLTRTPGLGSTVRIAWKPKIDYQYSIFFKCTADLVPAFRQKFPDLFKFGGNRSIDFRMDDDVPAAEVKQCIALALTYHRNRKLDSADRWQSVARA